MAETTNGGNGHENHLSSTSDEARIGAHHSVELDYGRPNNTGAALQNIESENNSSSKTHDVSQNTAATDGSKITKHSEDESGSSEGDENDGSEDNDENKFGALSEEEFEKSKTSNNPKENQSEDSVSFASEKIEASNSKPPLTDENPLAGIPKKLLPSEPAKKIKVHFVAVGSAPILKKSKFIMSSNDQFARAIEFVRKLLKRGVSAGNNVSSTSLFLYVNSAFVPSPDERIGDLFDCFGIRGELVLHYSLQEAWG